MGWLERVRQTRAEMVAPIRGQVVRHGSDAEQRFGLSQLMEMFSYAGVGYSTYGGDNSSVERDTNAFVHYVNSYYRDNGVIFAVILARMLLFTEARFQWQRILNGRPGDLFGTQELNLLENPWPNGTTGELLARMEQDVSLAGNFYATREKDRLRRLRPDWVEILLEVPPSEAVASNIKGYAYYPGGVNSRTVPKIFLPHEIAHWSPIPDPLAQYRGMSWISVVGREVSGDQAASDHKLKFFENAATPNLAVSFSENITKDQFNAFMAAMNAAHQGGHNAYKTLYLGGGADVKTIGANMEQMDFKATQGAGETRICAAGGVPPIIVGLSEGLQSATYSNYGMARRKFGDHWARPQWRSACAALSTIVEVPRNARLWYDDRDIAFLREDQKDVASIQTQQASTMKQLIDAGFEPETVKKAMLNEDWSLLEHTGLFSVQLQPPGAAAPQGGPPPDAPGAPPEAPGATGKPEETGPPSEGGGDLTKAEETKPDGKISPAAIVSEQNAALADLASQVAELRDLIVGQQTACPPEPPVININTGDWSAGGEARHFVGAEQVIRDTERSQPPDAERRAWDEAAHPRVPAGEGGGGQFMSYDESKNTGTGYGKKGGDADVRKLQEALNRLGLTDSKGRKLEVDGMLGPLTTAAVKKAQQLLGVKADGKVSPAMLKKILAMKKPKAGVKAQHDDKDDKPKPKQYHKAGTTQAQHDGKDEKPKPKAKPKQYHKAGVTQAEQQIYHQDTKRSAWNEADHPRGPDGKFSGVGSVVVIDPNVYREAFFNEPDPAARAADLYSDTMQGMNLIRTVIRNKQAGRSPFDDGDGRDVRDGEDYYLLQQHLLPLGQIKDPLSGDTVYGPEDLDREIVGAADLIERQIRQAPPATAPLSRGTRIPQSDLPSPGDEFDAGNAGVTSWTTDQDRADRYSMPGDLVEDGRRVRIVLDGPVPAHDLGSQKRTSRTGDDGEHLVGGGQRVRVASVEKQGDGPRAIFEIRVVPV